MTNRLRLFVGLFIIILSSVLGYSQESHAIPAFARTHRVPCTLCHIGFPKLNNFGMEFLQRGYRIPGKEGKFLWEQPIPLSGRVNLSYQHVSEDWDPESPFALGGFPPLINKRSSSIGLDRWELLAGGTLVPRISFLVQIVGIPERLGPDMTDDITIIEPDSVQTFHSGGLIPLPGAPALGADTLKTDIQTEEFLVQINDLLRDSRLNVRIGRYHVDNHFLSEPHRLTLADYLIQIQPILGPTLLPTSEGVEVNGSLPIGLRYAAGIRNYGPQFDSKEESELRVGAYYTLVTQMFMGQAVSFIVNGDRLGDANTAEDDRTLAYGASLNLNLGKLNIVPGIFQYKEGKNIRSNRELTVTSGTVEVMYPIFATLLGTARYDVQDWDLDEDSLDRGAQQYVISLAWYPYSPVRLVLEYSRLSTENLILISLPEGPFLQPPPIGPDFEFIQTVIALLFEVNF
jgi:hypothetical protein